MTRDYETIKMYGTSRDVTAAAYFCARGMAHALHDLAERVSPNAGASSAGSNGRLQPRVIHRVPAALRSLLPGGRAGEPFRAKLR